MPSFQTAALPLEGAQEQVTRQPAWISALLVLAAGYAHALSIAWPFADLGPLQTGQAWGGLQIGSLAVLAWQLGPKLAARRIGQAAKLAWLFACAMLCGTFWWLYISMHFFGGLPAPLAVLAVFALAAALGLYYALAGALMAWLAPSAAVGRATLFAAAWLLAEIARVQVFTGFPWGEGGYAHIDGWARPLAGWVGVHGLTLLAAIVAALLATCLRALQATRGLQAGMATAALLVACLLVSLLPAAYAPAPLRAPLSVTLVQGNIAQDQKFQAGTGVRDALTFYAEQLQAAQTALIVLPETALPLLPAQLPPGYWAAIAQRFASGQQAALIGLPIGSAQEGYSNAVLGLKPGATAYRYEKHHLVPFGEFVPPFFQWFIRMMNIPLGDFNRGPLVQTALEWQGERLAPNICYEDLFGEEIGAQFKDAARTPTVLVNVSNIAWFGNTVAIDQHLNISRMRSLEFARPMLRATNTGATVVIDAQGRVTHALERHTRGALVAQVQGADGLTLYARWVSHFGLTPWWLLGGSVLLIAALARWRTTRPV
ncbi:MAG: apolipoprotein N-acyltransferase [Polaromonas sp.]|nr:apolipoprotein N-acyltransferase [Polaromonas sp.]